MKILKKTYIPLAGYVEDLVRQIENYEALSKAGISDLSEKINKTKVHLSNLKKERAKTENRLAELIVEVGIWEERAKEAYNQDKEKALECLKRKNNLEKSISSISEQLCIYLDSEVAIESDLQKLSNKLTEAKNKRSIFLAKESSASAKQTASSLSDEEGLESVFDCWEMQITKKDVCHELTPISSADSLELEFINKEERQKLELELESLMSKE